MFRGIHKIVKNNLAPSHVSLSIWNDSEPTTQILMKSDTSIFWKSVKKIQV